MPRPDFPKTAFEFQEWFPNEESCPEYLSRCRWPDGFECPRCGHTEGVPLSTRPLIRCRGCNYQASLTAGTVMQDTRTPLRIWFLGAFLVATHTPGFSALQFQRYTGLKHYKVAFNILHKLRAAMVRPDRDKIRGIVEADETYVGGPKAGRPGRGAEGKVLVAAALEVPSSRERSSRVGRLRLRIVPDASARSLVGFIKANVEVGSAIRTDDWQSYAPLARMGYRHQVLPSTEMLRIHHIFGNLKTWLRGTHHGVSQKHLQAYLNEFVFRHNRRRTPMAAFQTVLGLATHAEGPTYASLSRAWVHPNPWG